MRPFERKAVFSRVFGGGIARLRDQVAGALARTGVGPDALTIAGLAVTLGAGVLLGVGAGDPPKATQATHGFVALGLGVWAGVFLVMAAACDMLDGALARTTGRMTKHGAFLDSCVDRVSDAAIFGGIAVYYVRHPEAWGAAWLAGLAIAALAGSELISYSKARGENFVSACGVGYWQRGERMVAILLGLFSGHVATVVVLLAAGSWLTACRRVRFGLGQIRRQERGEPLAAVDAKPAGCGRLALWRYRRGSLPYDILTAGHIALILFLDVRKLI